ncbi:DsbA family protein [Enterovibrio makurazakiensis]|uniref:DsbA family protein n=1 Tax=Enterovibrio gelatinilyticus TaxID=2899819 RepID=A0ABT5QWV3_9GAMM|nr:DsbA family protein [Enterovibrio sp. ZSDZ42]MDD1792503.1 DsbA family protein [Enterovibrio sp. ZSDZ42]
MKNNLLSIFLVMIATLTSFNAMSDTPLNKAQQQQLDAITALLEQNPDLISGLHQSLTQYMVQQQGVKSILAANHEYLYNNPRHTQFGASEPKLTIINFTDYNCPFCKKLDPVLHDLAIAYPQIKVVNIYVPLKEMGSLLSDVNSATYALNVWNQNKDKYLETHKLLIAKPSTHDRRSLSRIADKTGTKAQLKTDDITDAMTSKNYQLFNELGLRGTPAMIIDDQIVPGYVPIEKLTPIIESALSKS